MKQYNKLIRDRIPEIIAAKGEKAVTRILDDKEFAKALVSKLVEEAKEAEAAAGDKTELTKEIGDMWEVIEALIVHFGLDQREIASVKAKRLTERGGFTKKIFLERVEQARAHFKKITVILAPEPEFRNRIVIWIPAGVHPDEYRGGNDKVGEIDF